jgi:hypothetical protein
VDKRSSFFASSSLTKNKEFYKTETCLYCSFLSLDLRLLLPLSTTTLVVMVKWFGAKRKTRREKRKGLRWKDAFFQQKSESFFQILRLDEMSKNGKNGSMGHIKNFFCVCNLHF